MVTFLGTTKGTPEDISGYKQFSLQVQEYDSGKQEFTVIAYYPSDSARFKEIKRNLHLLTSLYIAGELQLRENQR